LNFFSPPWKKKNLFLKKEKKFFAAEAVRLYSGFAFVGIGHFNFAVMLLAQLFRFRKDAVPEYGASYEGWQILRVD